METPKSLPEWALILFILKEGWDLVKKLIVNDVKNNTIATIENSIHLKILNEQMKELSKLPKDVASAHSKIRRIESTLSIPQDT